MADIYRSRSFDIASLGFGGTHPVRIQSMTNTPTTDEEASLSQSLRIIEAGGELVRLTTQGKREVRSLGNLRDRLRQQGIKVPVIADIHFNPSLALEAAAVADKIRINPGNYLRGGSPDLLLPPLLETCRNHKTAIRIGVNHGSLDPSIIEKYGNSPRGMVESALQFLRVCNKHHFDRVVVSMKSSNPRVMIHAVRLLVKKMGEEGMDYPLHLGVTEAGDGMEGRIKSAVGMVPLLLEGMGDTLRVSLTEPPEKEIPVAKELLGLFPKPALLPYDPLDFQAWDPFSFHRRMSRSVHMVGAGSKVKIISPEPPEMGSDPALQQVAGSGVTFEEWERSPSLLESGDRFLLLDQGDHSLQETKLRLSRFCAHNETAPVVYRIHLPRREPALFSLELAGILGSLLADGAIDAVWVENSWMEPSRINEIVLTILQAAGARISKAEFIACPSCGRTHFDIISRLREIKEATSHLSSLKIAVMGCIVNGPGEMADAHYGYVGAGKGQVTLYKGRQPVKKNIRETEALNELIALMKQEGDWQDPS